MVMVVGGVRVPVLMLVAVLEQPGAGQVDDEADDGDRQRLVVVDRARRDQPLGRLKEHQRGDADQKNGAGVAAEHFDFPGPESEASVVGKTPRSTISQCRQAEREGV